MDNIIAAILIGGGPPVGMAYSSWPRADGYPAAEKAITLLLRKIRYFAHASHALQGLAGNALRSPVAICRQVPADQ